MNSVHTRQSYMIAAIAIRTSIDMLNLPIFSMYGPTIIQIKHGFSEIVIMHVQCVSR
jgi:hypothetical protein